MRSGIFMMPLHPASKDYHQVLEEDLEAIIHADRCGLDEVWLGEHFSCQTEPITSPLMFMAQAIPQTSTIKLCSGVLNLPQQHPAVVAGFAAMFDHLCKGRFVMGIGPGGLPSDFELFHLNDAMQRGRMMLESIDIIHKLWTEDPPHSIRGEYWQIEQPDWHVPEFGLGVFPRPYQKPWPPVAIASMSPFPFLAKEAAGRGWSVVSANFIPEDSVATHWQRYVQGCEEAGIEPDGANWRVARTILVTETDAEAERYLQRPNCAPRYYFDYLSSLMKKAGFSQVMKGLRKDMSDADLTPDWCVNEVVIAGSPATVADRINALRSRLGPFGTIVLGGIDWDDKPLWRNSMKLFAEQVVPKLDG